MTNSHRIPVTILTGFLGAGKTTLLNRILSEKHGLKIAVLENEFGEINIDSQLVVNADETVVEMSNGCICCSSQGDFVHQLLELTALRARFDYVVVEATGVADPASVLDVFLRNEDLREYYRLDGVITLVDALHVTQHISEAVCHSQIAFGDVVVINKADLVNEAKLQEVDRLVRAINPLAELYRTSNSAVPFEALLNIGQFDEERTRAALERTHAEGEGHEHCDHDHGHREHDHSHCDHDHGHCLHNHSHCDHDHGVCTVEGQGRGGDAGSRFVCYEASHPNHHHDRDGIGSLGIERAGDIDPNRFGEWISKFLAQNGVDIFRVKGIISLPGVANKFVVQAVHSQIDEPAERGPWNGATRVNQIVFIGRNLDRALITRGFEGCLVRK